MVEPRDGVPGAEEWARLPALKAVVRDDGPGLGKGVKRGRARRRAADLPDLDDSLDVFPPPREAGPALRKTGDAATRALGRGDAAQKGLDRGALRGDRARVLARRGTGCGARPSGSGIKPQPARGPGNEPGRRSRSSPPKAAATTGLRPRRSSRRRRRL